MKQTALFSISFTICLSLVLVFIISPSSALAYKHETQKKIINGREYIYHSFIFNQYEIKEIANSYRKAQGYANGMMKRIWDLASGTGADLGKFAGRLTLGHKLHGMAKNAQSNNLKEVGVKIRSRNDEAGKFALEFLDKVAKV